MKKNIVIIMLIILALILTFLIFNKDEILHNLREDAKKAHIGQIISEELMVFDTKKSAVKMKTLITQETLVFLYSDSCPPCSDAILKLNEYLMNNNGQVSRNLLVIVFEDEMPDSLYSYPNLAIYNIKKSRRNTIFAGYSTPVFHVFDGEGKLIKKYLGWTRNPDYVPMLLSKVESNK